MRRIVLPVALVALFACRLPSKRLTGSFIADGRPEWMGFLTMTQTGNTVSGYLMDAKPDGRGGTKSDTITVDGTTDGDAITLHLKSFLNLGNVTVVGRLSGDELRLTVPSNTGKVESTTFVRGTQERFNTSLAAWQTTIQAAYRQQKEAESVAATRAAKGKAARSADANLRDAARSLWEGGRYLHDKASFSQVLGAYDRQFKQLERQAEKVRQMIDRGKYQCWEIKNELTFVKSELGFVKNEGVFLENRAKEIEGWIAGFERRSHEAEQRLAALSRAVEDDPTGSVKAGEVKKLSDGVRQLVAAAPAEIDRARKVVADGRKSGADFNQRGEDLLDRVTRQVAESCPGK